MPNFLTPFGGMANAKSKYLGSLMPTTGSAPVPGTLPKPQMGNVNFPMTGATAPTPTPSPKQNFVNNTMPTNIRGYDITQADQTQKPNPYGTSNSTYTTPSGAVVTGGGQMVSQPPDQPRKNADNAFEAYIQTLNPSTQETDAQKYLNSLLSQKESQDFEISHRPGVTSSFAGSEQERADEMSNRDITGATNAYNAFVNNRTANSGIAKARSDYEQALLPKDDGSYSLSPGQVRYDSKGNVISSVPDNSTTGGFSLSPGENRYDAQGNLVASGGPKPPSQAQEQKQIDDQKAATAAQQSASQTIGLVNGLLQSDRYKSISGALQSGSIPFLGDRSAVNEYDQLQGLLKLGIRGLLKGQGAVSDYEGRILGQAASSLSRLTNESQMRAALQKVRGVLRTNNGQETEVVVKDPNGKVLGKGMLNGTDIYDAVSDGNTVEYQ